MKLEIKIRASDVEKELGGGELDPFGKAGTYFNEPEHLSEENPTKLIINIIVQPHRSPPKTLRDIIDNITKDLIERDPKPSNELDMPLQQRDFNSKTRFGWELFNCVKENLPQYFQDLYRDLSDEITKMRVFQRWTNIHFEYIFIDFGNGYSLDDYDYKLDARVIIGLRIAYAFFIEKKYVINFRAFLLKVIGFGDKIIKLFHVDTVIIYCHEFLKISNEKQLFLYIHIDEFQTIDSWDKQDVTNPPKNVFYKTIHYLSNYMIGPSLTIFVQPFLSGTAPHAVVEQTEPSNVSFEFVNCPLLNIASMIRIMDHFARKFKAKVQNRAYEWKSCYPILQLLMDTGGLPRALQRLFIIIFGEYVKWYLNEQYKIEHFITDKDNYEIVVKLMYYCIEGIHVTLDTCLDDKKPDLMIRSLERDRHIVLTRAENCNLYLIKMPFFFISIYNDILRIVDSDLTKKVFQDDSSMYWQEWEVFVAHHEAFRTNLAIRMGYEKLSFWELYPANMKLTTKRNEQIDWKNGDVVVLNGKSAEFADIFFVRETDDTSFFTMDQSKWDYASKTMTEDDVDNEEVKNNNGFYGTLDLHENYEPMTIIFTTQPYNESEQKSTMFAFTKNINPNFWDKNRLLNCLEGIGKAKIRDVFSKRPFINEEEFYRQIPDAKRQKLDFFPYDVPGTEPYVL
ncbi:8858_t:CDS:2 [Funneliformis caledonium]|uniref:8858_t:CDS:1 n=1 Tax=Funneliformis caledonium TaxID=1117310 RepID=A0A9N8ZN20_9GLOM|nr:8858_t:CDS:2 [Funneliformis caledonium]